MGTAENGSLPHLWRQGARQTCVMRLILEPFHGRMKTMQLRFPVVNIPARRRLGDWPATTMGPAIAPAGRGSTGVSPWDLGPLNNSLEPQRTEELTVEDAWSGKARERKPLRPPPEPEAVFVSDVLENPVDYKSPPQFITQEEADRRKNLTGLAVVGGAFAALVAAGLIAFR